MERRTRQLAAVYDVVRAAHDHPTAEDVCQRVRRSLPTVSLGTVYRNLQKLAAQQRVRIVHLTDRAARYDAMLADHDHFLCEQCGTVIDLPRPRTAEPDCTALGRAGYRVRAHALTFYGRCPECRQTAGGRSRGRRKSHAPRRALP
jgi:Fe2+ or Zn2+ uptake regulation protein